MLMRFLLAIAAIFLGILIVAALQPSQYSVTRSVTIGASIESVFSHLDDLKKIEDWSPWSKPVPKMTIVESRPPHFVKIMMAFSTPFEAVAQTTFDLKSEGTQTVVTQTIAGEKIYIAKVWGLFLSMETMIGSQVDKGLSSLKELSEKSSPPVAESLTSVDLTVVRSFPASRETVWKAWTEPEQVKRWWGPKNFTTPIANIDLREGGKYLVAMRSPDGQEFWSTGIYTRIVPQELLEAEDSFADEEGNIVPAAHYGMSDDFPLKMQLSIRFETMPDGGTRVTLVQYGTPAGQMYELSKTGWSESFDKLAAILK